MFHTCSILESLLVAGKAEADKVKATSRNELETTKSSYDIQRKSRASG